MAKSPFRLLFKITYGALAMLTIASLATPQAIAANLLPDSNTGAIILIGSIAILMGFLVFEIWKMTGKSIDSASQPRVKRKQTKRQNH